MGGRTIKSDRAKLTPGPRARDGLGLGQPADTSGKGGGGFDPQRMSPVAQHCLHGSSAVNPSPHFRDYILNAMSGRLPAGLLSMPSYASSPGLRVVLRIVESTDYVA